MANAPKTDAVDAELVIDDHWEGIAEVARKVERAADTLLLSGDAAQVRKVAGKVQVAAKVGRHVEEAVREISASVEKLESRLPFKLVRARPSPRG